SRSRRGRRRVGWRTRAGVDRARARSRRRVRRSWRSSLPFAAALLAAALQAPNYRVTYRLRVVQPAAAGAGTQLLARGVVTGPAGAGRPTRSARPPLWVEITVGRQFAAGETRASEEVTIVDSAVLFDAQAVIPPRRVTVRMSLVRGDTASSQRTVDFVPEAPGRRVSFVLGGETFDFDVTLERPEPPRTGRDSALAVDADVVCLRLLVPGSSGPARVRCGRL